MQNRTKLWATAGKEEGSVRATAGFRRRAQRLRAVNLRFPLLHARDVLASCACTTWAAPIVAYAEGAGQCIAHLALKGATLQLRSAEVAACTFSVDSPLVYAAAKFLILLVLVVPVKPFLRRLHVLLLRARTIVNEITCASERKAKPLHFSVKKLWNARGNSSNVVWRSAAP